MIIMCVLVVLATLIGHSESALTKCNTATEWGSVGSVVLTPDEACDTKCSRPKLVSATAYATTDDDGATWGCGACSTPENCVYCVEDNCNIEPTFECRTSKDDNTAKSLCPDKAHETAADGAIPETECKRTLWNGDEFGSTANGWGCGGCAENAEDCADCTSSMCNNVEGGDTTTRECRQYKKAAEAGSVFTENTEAKDTCYENTQGCRMPSPGNTAATWDACGDCSDSNAADCRACDTENCNDQATVKYCKTGEYDAPTLVSKFCTPAESKCQRPFNTYGTLATTINYECGDCEDGADTDTCKVCEGSDCNTPLGDVDTHKCFQYAFENNKWLAKAQEQCQAGDAAQKCNMPAKDAETPAADDVSKKGCGPCVAAAEKCTTTDAEKNVETTHKCHTWDWNDADGKKTWEFTKDAVDCYTADTATKCSLPKDRSKKDGFVGNGCTACGTDDANCMTTEKEENSGRRVIFSLLALALPIFYALL